MIEENGLIENLQVIVLMITVAAWLWLTVRPGHSRLWDLNLHPALSFLFAALYASFIMRELTWGRVLGFSDSQEALMELGNLTVLALALVWGGVVLLFFTADKAAALMRFIRSRLFLFSCGALALLLIGGLFERHWIPVGHDSIGEELFELAGYIVIAWIPFDYLRQIKSVRLEHSWSHR